MPATTLADLFGNVVLPACVNGTEYFIRLVCVNGSLQALVIDTDETTVAASQADLVSGSAQKSTAPKKCGGCRTKTLADVQMEILRMYVEHKWSTEELRQVMTAASCPSLFLKQ